MNHKCKAHEKKVSYICCADNCHNNMLCDNCLSSHKKYFNSHQSSIMKAGELSNQAFDSEYTELQSKMKKSMIDVESLHNFYLEKVKNLEEIIESNKKTINGYFEKNFYKVYNEGNFNPKAIEISQEEIKELKKTITLSDVEDLSEKYIRYLKLQSGLKNTVEKLSHGPTEIVAEIDGVKKIIGNIFAGLYSQVNSQLSFNYSQLSYLSDIMGNEKRPNSMVNSMASKNILKKFLDPKATSQDLIGNHTKCWGWKSFKILENSEYIVDAKLSHSDNSNEISLEIISLRDFEIKDEIKVKESFTQDTIILEYLSSTQEFGLTQFTDRIQRIWFFRFNPNADKKLEQSCKMFVGKGYIWDFCEFPDKNMLLVGTRGNDVSVFKLFEKTPIRDLSINRMDFFRPISPNLCLIGDKKKIHLLNLNDFSLKSQKVNIGYVFALDFDPSKNIVVAGDSKGKLSVFRIRVKGAGSKFLNLIFDIKISYDENAEILKYKQIADEKFLFTCHDKFLYLYDIINKKKSMIEVAGVSNGFTFFDVDYKFQRIVAKDGNFNKLLII